MARPITALIPELRDLQQYLTRRRPPESFAAPEEIGAEVFRFEMLPYALGSARQAVVDLARLQREAVEETVRRAAAISGATPPAGVGVYSLGPENWEPMSRAVEQFLDATRRAQNALADYISAAILQSLPQSLTGVVEGLERGKLTLPDAIRERLISYWKDHGRRLKDYRDLSQHHALVASDARVILEPGATPRVFLAIPNNPEEKSYRRLSFQKPTVQALPYILLELVELLRVTRSVARDLLATLPPILERVFTIAFRSPVEFGPGALMDGHVAPTEAEIEAQLGSVEREGSGEK
jgi:hypothetical protein